MEKVVRGWSEAEQQKLFDDYFSPLPAMCPICGNEVCMVMSCLRERVTLLLRCQGCGNKAGVSRRLSDFSPALLRPQDLQARARDSDGV